MKTIAIKMAQKAVMSALVFLFGGCFFSASSNAQNTIDILLKQTQNYLKTAPENSTIPLAQLKSLENTFNEAQKNQYYLHLIDSLAFRGKYTDQVELINSKIDQVTNPEIRARYLYNLADGYTNLGDYEHALKAMNDGILLLPKLVDPVSKMNTLQAAVALFESLHAYDDALGYADRIFSLEDISLDSVTKCVALADRVEIYFLRQERKQARVILPDAIKVCDSYGSKILVLIMKTLAAIDLINNENGHEGIIAGVPLLTEFSNANQTSDYVTQLEESIARAYLKSADLQLAERYGLQAYQHAQNSKVLQMMEKTSETMAKIKRAQGNMASALDYYDINLALKKKVLDDQLHKNLAYQRVKFDTQDKANQLSLLEQKNKILSTEKQLEQKNNQNLLMLIALGAILMVVLLAWTLKIIRQKNLFRLSSQLDALTQLSNRGHFVACGMQQFEKTQGDISVILFDMDHFKNINDGFGHASGDWVLKAVSARVTALLPKAEMLGRLGGEEFAICLPKFDTHQALALAESCRAAIAAIDSLPCGFAFPITASFGVASRGMRELKEFEDTLAAADKALYFSKTEGRNRVSLYQ
jgi:diguanylate cyclase (GGDEF)-like protein